MWSVGAARILCSSNQILVAALVSGVAIVVIGYVRSGH